MKSIAINFKHIVHTKIMDTILFKINGVDKFLLIGIFLIFSSIFLKIYFNGKFIAERSKIETLKVKIKNTESETKKLRFEIAKIRDKENLQNISKTKNMEEDIKLVVVKE